MRLPILLTVIAATVLMIVGCAPGDGRPGMELDKGDPPSGEECAVITTDGAWSWFGGPRAVTAADTGRTYVGWVTSKGDIRVGAYVHETGGVVATTLHDDFQTDDHANPSLLLDEDGRLMVFYSGHRGRWTIYRQMLRPHDFEAWTRERAAGAFTDDVRGYTYPSPVRLSSRGDSVLVFWRGPEYDPAFASSGDDRDWTPPRVIMEGEEQRYFKVACDDRETVHIAFSDGHPREVEKNGVWYVRLRDGVFERADGSVVGALGDLPIDPEDADRVYDGTGPAGRSWVWDVAADSLGRPVIVYAAFPAPDDHRYRYARWTGDGWEDHQITAAGSWFPAVADDRSRFEPYYSGGLCLDHDDPRTVYLSRPVNGVYEIERWTTRDGGRTWRSLAVTGGSVMNNVRPVVPRNAGRGGPHVIWMHGPYTDYMDYATDLRAR